MMRPNFNFIKGILDLSLASVSVLGDILAKLCQGPNSLEVLLLRSVLVLFSTGYMLGFVEEVIKNTFEALFSKVGRWIFAHLLPLKFAQIVMRLLNLNHRDLDYLLLCQPSPQSPPQSLRRLYFLRRANVH